jgi:hypothetical protein
LFNKKSSSEIKALRMNGRKYMKGFSEEGWQEDSNEFALPSNESAPVPAEFFFGKLPGLNSFEHDFSDLIELGNKMHGNSELNKELPAGYVFLGQFIDHDLAFDPERNLFPPETEINPATLRNGREPFLNLDSLYGGGPQVNPELYEPNTCLLKLGLTDIVTPSGIDRLFPNDLPRKPGERATFLADSRNGENLGVAQTHVAFIKFHNAVVKGLNIGIESDDCYKEARKIVTQHYQWIVLNDFLPKIIQEDVLQDVVDNGCKFYNPPNPKAPFMPVEFSTAAFRCGHSMVPRLYEWNRLIKSGDTLSRNTILQLFDNTGHDMMSPERKILTGAWIIDWRRFYDFTQVGLPAPANLDFYTFAHKTDTLLLREFKRIMFRNEPPGEEYKLSLAILNLYRGRHLGLPAGQDVADLFNVPRIPVQNMAEKLPDRLKDIFAEKTPLWYYILREAELAEKGARLGPVGSRILAEVFVKLIEFSPHSIRGEEFKENKWQSKLIPAARRDIFEMVDILMFVREQNRDRFDELNPIN